MKLMLLILLAGLCQLLTGPAYAQTVDAQVNQTANSQANVASSGVAKVIMVLIYAHGNAFTAAFDTDGQDIAGGSESSLNKQFASVKSPAAVINFVIRNGYRVNGFSTTQASTHGGAGNTGGGSNGYVVLFERTN